MHFGERVDVTTVCFSVTHPAVGQRDHMPSLASLARASFIHAISTSSAAAAVGILRTVWVMRRRGLFAELGP